jgi:hypothetical protein
LLQFELEQGLLGIKLSFEFSFVLVISGIGDAFAKSYKLLKARHFRWDSSRFLQHAKGQARFLGDHGEVLKLDGLSAPRKIVELPSGQSTPDDPFDR